MNQIASIAPDIEIAPIAGIAPGEQSFMTLDDRMLQAFAQSALALGGERQDVMQSISTEPGKLSDLGHLFALQQRISDYNLQVSLTSAVTRKAVSAVETLLRA
jgi:hypothetical protein